MSQLDDLKHVVAMALLAQQHDGRTLNSVLDLEVITARVAEAVTKWMEQQQGSGR